MCMILKKRFMYKQYEFKLYLYFCILFMLTERECREEGENIYIIKE